MILMLLLLDMQKDMCFQKKPTKFIADKELTDKINKILDKIKRERNVER